MGQSCAKEDKRERRAVMKERTKIRNALLQEKEKKEVSNQWEPHHIDPHPYSYSHVPAHTQVRQHQYPPQQPHGLSKRVNYQGYPSHIQQMEPLHWISPSKRVPHHQLRSFPQPLNYGTQQQTRVPAPVKKMMGRQVMPPWVVQAINVIFADEVQCRLLVVQEESIDFAGIAQQLSALHDSIALTCARRELLSLELASRRALVELEAKRRKTLMETWREWCEDTRLVSLYQESLAKSASSPSRTKSFLGSKQVSQPASEISVRPSLPKQRERASFVSGAHDSLPLPKATPIATRTLPRQGVTPSSAMRNLSYTVTPIAKVGDNVTESAMKNANTSMSFVEPQPSREYVEAQGRLLTERLKHLENQETAARSTILYEEGIRYGSMTASILRFEDDVLSAKIARQQLLVEHTRSLYHSPKRRSSELELNYRIPTPPRQETAVVAPETAAIDPSIREASYLASQSRLDYLSTMSKHRKF